jgi:hypothetical protein
VDGRPSRSPHCAVIRLISCQECITKVRDSDLCRRLTFVMGVSSCNRTKRFRLMNIRDSRIVLLVSIYSSHFIRIQPAVESLLYELDSNRMLLKCEYLNLWQRLGEVICQALLTIQSMKGFERGIEKSYFLPGLSSYILFAAVSLSKKTKPSSSSSFLLFPQHRDDLCLSFIYFFNFSRRRYRLLPYGL